MADEEKIVEAEEQVEEKVEETEEKVEEAAAEDKAEGKQIPKPDIDAEAIGAAVVGGLGAFLNITTGIVRSAVDAFNKAEENGTFEKIGTQAKDIAGKATEAAKDAASKVKEGAEKAKAEVEAKKAAEGEKAEEAAEEAAAEAAAEDPEILENSTVTSPHVLSLTGPFSSRHFSTVYGFGLILKPASLMAAGMFLP
jgi:cell division septum initiation protein DivIVA